jgi:hypothetical protein
MCERRRTRQRYFSSFYSPGLAGCAARAASFRGVGEKTAPGNADSTFYLGKSAKKPYFFPVPGHKVFLFFCIFVRKNIIFVVTVRGRSKRHQPGYFGAPGTAVMGIITQLFFDPNDRKTTRVSGH